MNSKLTMAPIEQFSKFGEIELRCQFMEQSQLKKFEKSEKHLTVVLSNTTKGKD